MERDFSRGRGRAVIVGRKHDLADPDLVAFLNQDFFDGSTHRRRHFHDGLVGFEFHHRLALAHRRAGRNHQAHQVALFNVFAECGKFEFDH